MKKTIAVSNVSQELIENLESMGYVIVDGGYEGYVDAILYDSDYSSLGYLSVFDNVIDMNSGAFLVDAKNKSAHEISNMIESRRHTSLF
jgi:hypothetical protein